MNITLRIADDLGKRARHFAIDEGKSLSAVVEELLENRLRASDQNKSERAHQAAWELIESGIKGGGRPFNREELYDR